MIKIILFLFFCFFSFKSFSNEVQIINETIGNGLEVKNHSKISVHYIGRLEDNTVFDSSYDRGQFFDFQIGVRKVILGWETGLLGMKEGGKRTIFIPYQLAYGESGAGNLIPPKSNLIFDIELIKVTPPGYKEINSYQLKLAMTDDFKIIDIRNEDQITSKNKIPGAINITAFDINGNFFPDFLDKYRENVQTGEKVIFISQRGDISSILANGFVEQLKQNNIYHLKDGISGLEKINFDFE
ncbi:FKBP-type peptidyl-prolyl cis-trans isomerase [Pelagibacteraceae bacterium]|nr:FKBP-type peptidyl-prolyl cis-trans isomerase [Pelagibacteraceae bacterium]